MHSSNTEQKEITPNFICPTLILRLAESSTGARIIVRMGVTPGERRGGAMSVLIFSYPLSYSSNTEANHKDLKLSY